MNWWLLWERHLHSWEYCDMLMGMMWSGHRSGKWRRPGLCLSSKGKAERNTPEVCALLSAGKDHANQPQELSWLGKGGETPAWLWMVTDVSLAGTQQLQCCLSNNFKITQNADLKSLGAVDFELMNFCFVFFSLENRLNDGSLNASVSSSKASLDNASFTNSSPV